ncbi:hypothetical protein GH714_003182 [Hevea brasiliensis]|uniref:Integrase zinc-binding domain-containing protein n=1 Tax=Hevea brasiliensis TaxID=3981 RepID=A0A6A6N8Z5_HEVBR|nr:hypothetical protein GH714_003182 [Hevea brasiliensis]
MHIRVDEGSDDEEEMLGCEEELVTGQELQMSLNAMRGTPGAQTMCVAGTCGKRSLQVLIDTGSTYNFLDSHIARKVGCELVKVTGVVVEVANGQELQCEHFYKEFTWSDSTTWQTDPHLQSLILAKQQDSSSHIQYNWISGCLRRKGKLVVGDNASLRLQLLKFFHDSPLGGHSGVHATFKRMSAVVYWKGCLRL